MGTEITNSERFWIVVKTDDAIAGHSSGTVSQETIFDAFTTHDAALDKLPRYRNGSTYYAIVRTEGNRPADFERSFGDKYRPCNDY